MIRLLLGAAGVVASGYGVWLLLGSGWDDTLATGMWLAGGVVAHDLLVAPATIGVGVLLARRVPERWGASVIAGTVVVATVTLAAVPVLGRFGARPDNPTLLDRDYVTGWLVFVAVVALGTLGHVLWHARRTTGGGTSDGTDPGRR
jgi:hypothetical protein